MKTKFFLTTDLAFARVLIFSMITGFKGKKPWVIPYKNAKMKNPVASNAESLKNGKELWIKNANPAMVNQGMAMDHKPLN